MGNKVLVKYKNVELCQQDNIVLRNVDVEIHAGELIYLLGKVGSGKSTFLKSLYAEIPIEQGDATILEFNLSNIKNKQIPILRRKVGIVFQDFQLLTDRNVSENLKFVLKATGWKNKVAIEEQINLVLKQVGMQNKGYKMPHQLSGGEQQRIVIARALLNSPEIILADEPTGNLDSSTGKEIMDLLYEICKSGTTVIIATHNLSWINEFDGRVMRCEHQALTEITSIKQ